MTVDPTDPNEPAIPDGYHLVMPIVACRSRGGPFDDAPYVAGWEMGSLFQILAQSAVRAMAMSIRADNQKQADLIAMNAGFTMHVHGVADGWASVEFRHVEDDQ